MIDITPFGRQLMGLAIGRIAYMQNTINKNINIIQKHQSMMKEDQEDLMRWDEMNFNLSVSLLDKRFKESKAFIQSGGDVPKNRFKRSSPREQIELQTVIEKSVMKSRMRYEKNVSSYNKLILEKTMQSAVKKLSLM
ncbi:MAG TPA: hypothetical protein PLJ98_05440 [Acholeplasmataceae bacterium]|nr:hypothetical protein [Acholeplasmataceae bacterium]